MLSHRLGSKKRDIFAENQIRGDINVTPLVDVCLVLLIIFMVVTPMLQPGVDVALPQTSSPEKMPETARQLTVSVKQDGNVFVEEKWVPEQDLEARFGEIYTNEPDRQVVVKGDSRLKYKEVRRVMQLLNEAGFGRVGLVTQKEEGGGGA
jgi:biopolymer transport protein ExbD